MKEIDFHGLYPMQAIGEVDRLIVKFAKTKKPQKVSLIVGHGIIRGIVCLYLQRAGISYYYNGNNDGVIVVHFNEERE